MTPRHVVVSTTHIDATPIDVERWAAARGVIVTNVRPIPEGVLVEFNGKILKATDSCHVWIGDIVIDECGMSAGRSTDLTD